MACAPAISHCVCVCLCVFEPAFVCCRACADAWQSPADSIVVAVGKPTQLVTQGQLDTYTNPANGNRKPGWPGPVSLVGETSLAWQEKRRMCLVGLLSCQVYLHYPHAFLCASAGCLPHPTTPCLLI